MVAILAGAWSAGRRPSPVGTSSTTGTTGSCTRCGRCGRSTSCTTRASATTSRPRCANRWPTCSACSCRTACSPASACGPRLIAQARGINLIYQYWIHTDAIRRLGAAEEILNTPSHHRVHHGRNSQYIDRNHGSILIVWDRLFGTFEREERAGRLRPHQEHQHLQPGPDRQPRAPRHRAGRRRARRIGATASRSWCAGRAGPTSATPSGAMSEAGGVS